MSMFVCSSSQRRSILMRFDDGDFSASYLLLVTKPSIGVTLNSPSRKKVEKISTLAGIQTRDSDPD